MLKYILIIQTIFLISCGQAQMPSDGAIKEVSKLCEKQGKVLKIHSTYGFVKTYCEDLK